jgi:hypothetical protein
MGLQLHPGTRECELPHTLLAVCTHGIQKKRGGMDFCWSKSKPRLLPKKRLEEGNGVSKEERKEAEQEQFEKIPKEVLRNGMV